jgi:5'-nucleotidase
MPLIDKMNILVCNDDGIDSPGIYALVKSLKDIANITVVAPDRQQSAVGHALTLSSPLRVIPYERDGEIFGYSVNGTPADCVKIALSGLLDKKPDLVVSGINHGQNTAVNILYSGTVSAASEGYLSGIKSIAFSLASHDYKADFSVAQKYANRIVKNLLSSKYDENYLLNVNIPYVNEAKIKGIKLVHHSDTVWKDKYEKRKDPFDREYYWFAGEYKVINKDPMTDDIALSENYVTITPLTYQLTDFSKIDSIKFLEE